MCHSQKTIAFSACRNVRLARRGRRDSLTICVLLALLSLSGCAGAKRPSLEAAEALRLRGEADAQAAADTHTLLNRLVERTKRLQDEYAAGSRPAPPVVDILVISGGGDWGAFGAGFLKGWSRVPANDPLAKPDFAVVTGVSTGALIAPFAFVGDADSIDVINHLYRHPQKDWVVERRLLYFLPGNSSLARIPGLERELKTTVTPDLIRKIAARGADGRMLAVNTTDVDNGNSHVFDLVAEAKRANETGEPSRLRNVMLASAGIPGVFPFRMIDDVMHVDGGVTGNIIYGGRVEEEETFPALWQRNYPGTPIPKTRYWIVFNNQFRPPPQTIQPRWLSVIQRSMETSTRAATLTDIRHLCALAEISRLKRGADVEVRIASIPGDWIPPTPKPFAKETMNQLADLGERMGADPKSWSSDRP